MQTGFFDWQFRYEKLDATGDPLVKLNTVIKWERFRPLLETIREKDRKSNAGAKIGLRNLAYNRHRYRMLATTG